MKNRLIPLDCFRGLAALAVVIYHYTHTYRVHYGNALDTRIDFRFGYLGVHFFFIISGFVIFLTLQNSSSAKDFLYKRFSRLYPVFWTCLTITFLAIAIWGLPGREKSFFNLKWNYTMIPLFFKKSAIDGAYWSLMPEFFFYLAMALIFTLKNKKAYYGWMIVILTLACTHKLIFTFPEKVVEILNLKYGSLFITGILFYKIKYANTEDKYLNYTLLVVSLIVSLMYLNHTNERAIVSCYYIIFSFFSLDKLNWLSWKPLLFLGKISYPLYLLNQNIGYVILNYTKPYLSNYPAIFILTPILTIILLAYLVNYFVEIKSIYFLRKIQPAFLK